jgi:fatty acyl-CoA reductase
VAQILASPLFNTLRASMPEFDAWFLQHVTAVSGELGVANLIDNDAELALLRERVQIVVHCAASVTFTSPLHEAIVKNVSGALDVFGFATTLPLLESYCHVSTAYVNCNKLGTIGETLPTIELPAGVASYEAYYAQLASLSESALAARSGELLGAYPNTYCFSKALAELVLVERARGYPLCIVRPTIVGGAAIEPVPGWTDSVNAVGAVTLLSALGILRCLYAHLMVVPDVVPVDLVVGAIIAAVPYVAGQREAPPLIVHAGSHKPLYTWEHHRRWAMTYFNERRLERAISQTNIVWLRSRIMFFVYVAVAYRIPLYVLESYLSVVPHKSLVGVCASLRKVSTGIVNNTETFKHFLCNEWQFDTTNLMHAWAKLPASDRARVLVSPNSYDTRKYMLDFCEGIGMMVDKKPATTPLSDELVRSAEFSEVAIQERVDLYCRAVDLQDYVDTLAMLVPPTVYLAFKAATGSRLWSLLVEPRQQRSVTLARCWLLAGVAAYAFKKVNFARGVARRIMMGQPRARAAQFERHEAPMIGWFFPFGASLLALLLRRSSAVPAGFALAQDGGGNRVLALLRLLLTLGGRRWAGALWTAVLSYLSFNFVESAVQLGARPITWRHIAEELPAWRKTVTFATFVALIRVGKGRESQGMQHWLKLWERGSL